MNNNDLTTMTESKQRKLKHVKVYDKLYAMIKDGTFKAGDKLPTEPELAAMMDVSRMTLRRALALLEEDELVELVRGKGNFIKNPDNQIHIPQLNTIQHPFYACCGKSCDDLELEFRIEIPSEAIAENIEQPTAAVVITDRWYKQSNKIIGYTLSFIPIEVISAQNINLNEPAEIKNFIEKDIYTKSFACTSTFSYTVTGNFTATKYSLSNKDAFILIQETLYDKDHKVIIYNKHYIPVDNFKMKISLTSFGR